MRKDNVKFTAKLTVYILPLNSFCNYYEPGKFLSNVFSPSFTSNATVPFYPFLFMFLGHPGSKLQNLQ